MRSIKMNDATLKRLQKKTFNYFIKTNSTLGLIPDNTHPNAPCSIAVVGMALSSFCIGVENGFLSRHAAIKKTLTILRFFWESPQGQDENAIGYQGFFYHFLDMKTGKKAPRSELSSIDTAFLVAGGLTVAEFFNKPTKDEKEIRKLAKLIYERVNWKWMLDGKKTLCMGWKPTIGFLKAHWHGYSEAIILYVLALASSTFPIPASCYDAWLKTYKWKKLYNIEFLYAGPLSIHQLSHLWIDFRGIQDKYMQSKGIDYFENSRRATYIQQNYAIQNPHQFKQYGKECWGVTASDGPGPATRNISGKTIKFYNYKARQIPNGPDDGTIAPRAALGSLPFAPEIVLPVLAYFNHAFPYLEGEYGLMSSFNPTFKVKKKRLAGWISESYYGLDQGTIVLMIDNYRTGNLWRLMRNCSYIQKGLKKAKFSGGWL